MAGCKARKTLGRLSLRLAFFIALPIWAAGVGFVFHRAMLWESTPGHLATQAPLPAPKTGRPSLLLVMHTECPCSAASLKNLLTLPADDLQSLDVTIVFAGPDANANSKASNVVVARSIPGATLEFCTEEEALSKYHAETSGQAFLFNKEGKLAFSGGLTVGRGEPGASAGMNAIQSLLRGQTGPISAPVYGCSLQTPHHDKSKL